MLSYEEAQLCIIVENKNMRFGAKFNIIILSLAGIIFLVYGFISYERVDEWASVNKHGHTITPLTER